ncbi:DUF3168 domain-containing protein [Methanogenium cariaci]|jgi:uncharacterized protein DUF3168|uniref:DUF3168 domain-containing protein n=1 Tax=Methanogenium cariaci TaxID=2197 RepID=UPI0007853044|nr:DUF3168 domain-containing protein [Methanogenium cariaci]
MADGTADVLTALRSVLVANETVAGLVGTRIYRMHLPQDPTLPAITFQMISRPEDAVTAVASPRVQYTCYAESSTGAAALAKAVRKALHQYYGVHGDIRISRCFFSGQHDDYDEVTGTYIVPVDFRVYYQE